jgi:hypothetical protein
VDLSLVEKRLSCPYCGEPISLLVDPSAGSQSYIEDCQVCCRPIEVTLQIDEDDEPAVTVDYAG